MASIVLLLLLSVNRALSVNSVAAAENEYSEDVYMMASFSDAPIMDVYGASRSASLHFRMFSALAAIDDDLGFWVKPSEMFAISRSTVSIILREVVHNINDVMRKEVAWPSRDNVYKTADDFYKLCGLPGVVGAIDGTHIGSKKPHFGSVDYYYFKSGGFSITCQAVVDSSKLFLDVYVGMPGSTNDSRVLLSALHRKG